MQSQLWSEVVRTSEALDSMIFPRLVAMAERAWHRADWETMDDQVRGCSLFKGRVEEIIWARVTNSHHFLMDRVTTILGPTIK